MTDTHEDELHRRRSDTLVNSLLYGSPAEVIDDLCKLDRLDGEPFQILIWQLTGTCPAKYKFRNRFQLVGSRGRTPHPLSEPAGRGLIRTQFMRWRKEGLTYKQAMYKAERRFEMKRSLIAEICGEAHEKKKTKKTNKAKKAK
jgi:hypothetical protein